jgi:hypothetical protein
MKTIPCCVLILCLVTAAAAHAQSLNDLQIRLGAYTQSDNGGETPAGVWRSTGPLVIGKATPSTFSVGGCGYGAVSSDGSLREDATTAWRVEVTPRRVVSDAVTFRLRWVRSVDNGKAFTVPNEDAELTLRPGESRLVDSVPVPPGAKTFDGQPCKTSVASVRVAVDYYPEADFDRRLVAAELWLVERLSNGTERTQPLSVRGLPNRPIPFYFDSIVDGSLSLDIFGRVVARLASGAMEVSFQTRSRWGEDWGRSVESVIHVKPGEVIDVRLPKLGDGAGPFANRDLSIRVRARQLR